MPVHVRKNMGTVDRLLRGLAGSALLVNGLNHRSDSPVRKLEAAIGGAFLAYSVSGFDPLLSVWGASTIPGKENNCWNLLKAKLPGQGMKPHLTQNVWPRKPPKRFRTGATVSEAMAIGYR